MKVGPLALPVANAKELLGFALLVVAIIYVTRKVKTSLPATVQPYFP